MGTQDAIYLRTIVLYDEDDKLFHVLDARSDIPLTTSEALCLIVQLQNAIGELKERDK